MPKRPARNLPALATLTLAACTNPTPPFPPDDTLEPMLEYLVEDSETPAIVLGLLEPGGSTRILTYGTTGTNTPLTPQSVFEIGSITKTFTGTLLADMVARGEVALDDPVSRYLPEDVEVPTFAGREITLVDLATHTSGLPTATGHTPADPQNPWADWTPGLLYAWLSEAEFVAEPSTRYEYSNVGMGLLGHALGRAANSSFSELVQERILNPLGMSLTGHQLEGDLGANAVQGHQMGDAVPHWTRTDAIAGAGGLNSTVEDLLTYLAVNIGEPETDLERAMRVAHEPRRPTDDGAGVGLAWNTSTVNGHRIISHSGGTGGFRTQIAFDPDREIGFVVLTNSASFQRGLGMELLAGVLPPTYPEVEVQPDLLEPYVGTYVNSGGLPLYIRLEDDGHLSGQAINQVRFRMYPTSDSTFFAKRVPFVLVFRRDENREVEDILLGVRGNTNDFPRVGASVPPSTEVAGNVIPPISAEEIAIYEGTYLLEILGVLTELRIYGDGERLMANLGNQLLTRLIPRGEHEFETARDDGTRAVFSVENDRATGVSVTQNGQTIQGDRQR